MIRGIQLLNEQAARGVGLTYQGCSSDGSVLFIAEKEEPFSPVGLLEDATLLLLKGRFSVEQQERGAGTTQLTVTTERLPFPCHFLGQQPETLYCQAMVRTAVLCYRWPSLTPTERETVKRYHSDNIVLVANEGE